MNVITKPKLLLFTFLLMFLWVEVAEARLFRTSGRGTQQDQYSEAIYYVNNAYLNDIGITPESYDNDTWSTDFNTRTGGFAGVEAVPSECTSAYIEDKLNDDILYWEGELSNAKNDDEAAEIEAKIAALQAQFTGVPCIWEFEQGEEVFTWGAFNFYFDSPDVLYDVDWFINGQHFDGYINTNSNLKDPNDNTHSIDVGSVMLSTPLDLAPGDYDIRVDVSISSDSGKFYYVNEDQYNTVTLDEQRCEQSDEWTTWNQTDTQLFTNEEYDNWVNAEPEYEICGYVSSRNTYEEQWQGFYDNYREEVNAPTLFSSVTDTLRILPSSDEIQAEPTPANAPASIGLFMMGLGGIIIRRRSFMHKR